MSENMSKNVAWWGSLEESVFSEGGGVSSHTPDDCLIYTSQRLGDPWLQLFQENCLAPLILMPAIQSSEANQKDWHWHSPEIFDVTGP
jgi:hypothetical protein